MALDPTRWLRHREERGGGPNPEMVFNGVLRGIEEGAGVAARGPFAPDSPYRNPDRSMRNEYTGLVRFAARPRVDGAPFTIAKYAFFREKGEEESVGYEVNLFVCLGEDGRTALLLGQTWDGLISRSGRTGSLWEVRWFSLPANGLGFATATPAALHDIVRSGVRLLRALGNCPWDAGVILSGQEDRWTLENRRDFLLEFERVGGMAAVDLWNSAIDEFYLSAPGRLEYEY